MIDDGSESVLAGILFAESKISQRQRKTNDAKESLQVKQGKKRKQQLRPRLHGLISGIGRNCTELHAFLQRIALFGRTFHLHAVAGKDLPDCKKKFLACGLRLLFPAASILVLLDASTFISLHHSSNIGNSNHHHHRHRHHRPI